MASLAATDRAAEPPSIIVTGASSGIGAYCARALKADGWRVFATARKAADIAALEAEGFEAFFMDYRDAASIEALVTLVLERTGGRLDALYNNGAHAQAGAVEDLPVEALRDQFEANVFGWHDLTRRVVPVMRRQGHGRLVHCSSVLGLMPARFRGAYCASKYAIEGLMLCLRQELRGSGIHVSLIEPGPVRSNIHANGRPLFEKTIDKAASVHSAGYGEQMEQARLAAAEARRNDPQVVYAALRHALLSQRPKPHYVVTMPARLGVILKRVLPAALFYRILARTT
ncbi:SDR family oxidoreductase [Ollibium composti]|uniref:SDR family oxidoreductase n=1 Tax=Ollibium composti TaxID=2675109 RepID=A0ABY2Q328_9HYPH|nr:SDR family oxidoreductase [Mesorhizobium composti]THF55038.1 SDR family oxidoreductase [Mesorhizobium composti]